MGIKEAQNRPSWDIYFIAMAFIAAQRSIDQHTKCGCVIVSKDKRVLSVGYNGPIKSSNDADIPLTRPEKYAWIIHSELNAILSYNGSLNDIDGATIYVTSKPCHNCTKAILQKGIKTIVYCDATAAKAQCVDEQDMIVSNKMIEDHKISIRIIPYNDIKNLMKNIKFNK